MVAAKIQSQEMLIDLLETKLVLVEEEMLDHKICALRLTNAINRYIEMKVRVTRCRQNRFKRGCQFCGLRDGCELYAEGVEAWMQLQSAVGWGVKKEE